MTISILDSTVERAGQQDLTGLRRALAEFLGFGIKQARACLFAGLFFVAVFGMPRAASSGFHAMTCCS